MERTSWPDERIDERMNAIDTTFERLHTDLGGIRDEIRGLRDDISASQRQIAQIGWALAGALIASMVALIIAVI